MTKSIKHFVIALLLFSVSSPQAIAGVRSIVEPNARRDTNYENYPSTVDKPCFSQGYSLVTCPTGKTPEDYCPSDSNFFKSCTCDFNLYSYSEQNCDTAKYVLNGETCSVQGQVFYKGCICKSDFKKCDTGSFPSSETCTDSDGTKYAICNEDIPSCESIGYFSAVPSGQTCETISNEYMNCYRNCVAQ
ncbi:MAG: hypothetical protein PHE89_07725 [Alphaproteobacteria bacterium]|nr:hypothetical protein [Alphaproteobacteria bacterium]